MKDTDDGCDQIPNWYRAVRTAIDDRHGRLGELPPELPDELVIRRARALCERREQITIAALDPDLSDWVDARLRRSRWEFWRTVLFVVAAFVIAVAATIVRLR